MYKEDIDHTELIELFDKLSRADRASILYQLRGLVALREQTDKGVYVDD